MGLLKLLLVVVLVMVGYRWWHKHHELFAENAVEQSASATGFVPMPPPLGASLNRVLIFAPRDCPSAAAQRARDLSQALADRGVPHAMLDEANFDLQSPEQVTAVQKVMGGTVPIVFFHGRGKANPSLEDVLAEYTAARR